MTTEKTNGKRSDRFRSGPDLEFKTWIAYHAEGTITMAFKSRKELSSLSEEQLEAKIKDASDMVKYWERMLDYHNTWNEFDKLDSAQKSFENACEELDRLTAELERRLSACLTCDMLERTAQEVIGELEMDALLLTRDTDVEVIRCTRFDGSTYLTTRRRALVHA